jgi:GNAT superfamily N-acetyltransferase
VKQIGPSLFVGDDPYFCHQAAELLQESRRRNLNKERQTPSDRFLAVLNERTTKPKRYGFLVDHSYFRFGEHTLISVVKTKGLSGVPDCDKFMCHLESIYVVDVARGQGYGTACIDMLTEVAEETGCVIDLFCNPFVWSFDGANKYAIESFDQLWEVVFDDRWDVLYHRDMQSELTKLFYARLGFVNMCLYDKWVYGRDKTEDLPFEQQFAYLPTSLNPSYRNQLLNRLSPEGCEYCNRR